MTHPRQGILFPGQVLLTTGVNLLPKSALISQLTLGSFTLSSRDWVPEQSGVDWFYFHFLLALSLSGGFQGNFRQSKSFLLASWSTKTLGFMRAMKDAERSGMSNVKNLYRAIAPAC